MMKIFPKKSELWKKMPNGLIDWVEWVEIHSRITQKPVSPETKIKVRVQNKIVTNRKIFLFFPLDWIGLDNLRFAFRSVITNYNYLLSHTHYLYILFYCIIMSGTLRSSYSLSLSAADAIANAAISAVDDLSTHKPMYV